MSSTVRLFVCHAVLRDLCLLEALLEPLCNPPAVVTVAYGDYRATVCSHDITPQLAAMRAAQQQLSLFGEIPCP